MQRRLVEPALVVLGAVLPISCRASVPNTMSIDGHVLDWNRRLGWEWNTKKKQPLKTGSEAEKVTSTQSNAGVEGSDKTE